MLKHAIGARKLKRTEICSKAIRKMDDGWINRHMAMGSSFMLDAHSLAPKDSLSASYICSGSQEILLFCMNMGVVGCLVYWLPETLHWIRLTRGPAFSAVFIHYSMYLGVYSKLSNNYLVPWINGLQLRGTFHDARTQNGSVNPCTVSSYYLVGRYYDF